MRNKDPDFPAMSGETFAQYRREHGWSQDELGRIMGYNLRTINRWETNPDTHVPLVAAMSLRWLMVYQFRAGMEKFRRFRWDWKPRVAGEHGGMLRAPAGAKPNEVQALICAAVLDQLDITFEELQPDKRRPASRRG